MKMQSESTHKHWHRLFPHALFVLGCCALGFVFRALYYDMILGGSWKSIVYPDEINYYAGGAKNFLEQGWAYFSTPRSLWNTPLNVLWTSIWYPNYQLQKICNLAALSLAGIFIWDISRRLFSLRAAYIALALYTAYLPFCHYGPTILSEPIYVTLLVVSFWFLSLPASGVTLILSGVLLGMATLVRPTTQFFGLFLVCLLAARLCLAAYLRHQTTAIWRQVIVLVIGFVLVVGPWSLKNYLYFGSLTLANGSGAVLYLGNDLRKNGDEPVYSEMQFDTGEVSTPYVHLDTGGDRLLREAALQSIAEHPFDIALLTIRKAFRYVFGSPASYFYPWRDILVYAHHKNRIEVLYKVFEVSLICVVALFGIFSLGWLRVGLAHFVLSSFVLYMICLHAIAFPIPRLALPIYPVLALLASGRASHFRFFPRKSPSLSQPSSLVLLVGAGIIISAQLFSHFGKLPYAVSERYSNYFELVANLEPVQKVGLISGGKHVDYQPVTGAFAAKVNQVVFVELSAGEELSQQAQRAPLLKLLWRTGSQRRFKSSRSKVIHLYRSKEKQLYRIVPSLHAAWSGKIAELRLQVVNGAELEGDLLVHRVWVAK